MMTTALAAMESRTHGWGPAGGAGAATTAPLSSMAEFSQPVWLKTTNHNSLRPAVFGKRLKENINTGFVIWQSSCFDQASICGLQSFDDHPLKPPTKEQ